jgi:hypothetical protein
VGSRVGADSAAVGACDEEQPARVGSAQQLAQAVQRVAVVAQQPRRRAPALQPPLEQELSGEERRGEETRGEERRGEERRREER